MKIQFGSRFFKTELELFNYIDSLFNEVALGSGVSAFRLSLLFSEHSGLINEVPNILKRYNYNEKGLILQALPLLREEEANGCEEAKSILNMLSKC